MNGIVSNAITATPISGTTVQTLQGSTVIAGQQQSVSSGDVLTGLNGQSLSNNILITKALSAEVTV